MTTAVITKPTHYIKREGEFQRQQFHIAASQEAFRILSDGLYSQKTRAVIRELSTNAVDSHIVAGNSEPFEVHLPSIEQPWFSVKDFGTGLSHEDVMHLYSTYFGTNKADDIFTTGCLGLGSKSPFAKVRSFTVISRHGGWERHYIVAFNEDRIPEVNYLEGQDKPTTSTGMEIKMSVGTNDIYEFGSQASEVYYYFDEKYRPRVLNGKYYQIPKHDILLDGTGWRLLSGSCQPTAIQGNIGYPIVARQIKNIDQKHESVLSCNIEIDFPNNSLAFTPSREHLSYNKSTCENLISRLDEIICEVSKTISQRFEQCNTLWEARTLAWSMFWARDAELIHLKKLADTNEMTWRGQPIAGQQLSFDDIGGVEAWSFKIKERVRGWSNAPTTTVQTTERKELVPRRNVLWVELDIPRGSKSRCQQYVRENPRSIVYLISFEDQHCRQAFCDKMGLDGSEFIRASSLPKPSYNRGGSGRIHKSTSLVYEHKGQESALRCYQYWQEVEVDLNDGGVYVEMKNNKVLDLHGKRVDPALVGSIMRVVNNLFGENLQVFGIRPQIAKQFHKSDDWVDVFTYVRNLIKIRVVQDDIMQHVANAEHFNNFDNAKMYLSLAEYAELFDYLPENDSLRVLLKNLLGAKHSKAMCQNSAYWRQICAYCGHTISAKSEYDLDADVENVFRAYPMLEAYFTAKSSFYASHNLSEKDIESVDHYVGLVHKSRNLS